MYIDTETRSADAEWTRYPNHRSPVDGVVHRVVRVHHLAYVVHDEAMAAQVPVTGCGIRLSCPEFEETPESFGFCTEAEPLSCIRCASGVPEEGDVYRQMQKLALFGALYGKTGAVLSSSQPAGKSYSLKTLAKTIFGDPLRHRARHASRQPPPPRLRPVLARAVWAFAEGRR